MNNNLANTSGSPAGRFPEPRSRAWIWACLLLLAVTWGPVFGVHAYRTSLSETGTGAVVVVFPPTSSTRELFRDVMGAGGSLVRPVRWLPNTWVVRSLEPGFAGRLKERGAWAVHSADLLNASALLSCLRIAAPPPTSSASSSRGPLGESPPPAS